MTMLSIRKSLLLLMVLGTATASPVVQGTPRIIGGIYAEPGDFPYFVHIGNCGGALIAPDVVLSAAHCVSPKDKQVIIGAYELMDLAGGAQERFCDDWITDPKYGTERMDDYDFALCKLNKPVVIDDSKVRLELNQNNSLPVAGEDLDVMGFGVIAETPFGPIIPFTLQRVTVPAIDNAVCNQSDVYSGYITDTMLCAGFLGTGGKDACQGDSGGPLVQRTVQSDGTFVDTHMGVVSGGEGCALKNKPGIYARTSARWDWIRTTMCQDLQSIAPFCGNEPPPPEPCEESLTIRLTTDLFPDETKWILKDASGNLVMTRQYFIQNLENEHTLCLKSDECYEWTIYDGNNDGLCVEFTGECGSYSFELNGEEIFSGNGDFGGAHTESFCTSDTDLMSAPPTSAPSQSPSDSPSKVLVTSGPSATPTRSLPAIPDCEDSTEISYRGKRKSCSKLVGKGTKKNVRRRCRQKVRKKRIFELCPKTCGKKCNSLAV